MSLDASRLQISVEEQEHWRRRMSVTVPAALVQAEEQKAARHFASRARLKGFRKGRVPTKVIKSRFGGTLRQEALDKLIGDAYRQALASEDLRPISEGELQEVKYEPEQDLVFSIAFDVQPKIELGRLGGFAVERPVPEVTDEHVDSVLTRIREQNGAWKPAEEGPPEDRDLVSVAMLKLDDEEAEGRDYDFVLGQGDALPDIEAAIKTLDPGGEGDFDIAFPDDFPDESRRGDSERLRITLTARKTLELPELDDDLARQVGDFESLGDLEAKVREDLEKDAGQQAESVVRGRLLDLLLDANPFHVPQSMVDRYADGVIGDQTDSVPEDKLAEIRESIRPEAERAVKRILLIERVAETQELTATDDDIDARVEEIAEANDTMADKVYAEMQKAGRIETLERELTERRVFEFLMEQSEITDAPLA